MATLTTLPIPGQAAIRIQNIYAVLGLTGGDLGWVCSNRHGKTDKWARYKPQAVGGPAPITEAQRKADSYGLRPSDPEALGGLNPLSDTDLRRLAQVKWLYAAPVPGENWCRMTDWDGYEHTAVAPMTPPGDITLPFGQYDATVSLQNTQIHTVSNLGIEDFPWAADKYLCVVIFRERKSDGVWEVVAKKTTTATIADGGRDIDLNVRAVADLVNKDLYEEPQFILCLTDSVFDETAVGAAFTACQVYPLVTDVSPVATLHIPADPELRFTATGVSLTATRPPMLLSNFQLVAVGEKPTCFATGAASQLCIHGTITNDGGAAVAVPRRMQWRVTTRVTLSTPEGFDGEVQMEPEALWLGGTEYSNTATMPTLQPGGSIAAVFDLQYFPRMTVSGVVAATVRDHVFLNINFQQLKEATGWGTVGGCSLYISE